MFKLSFVTKETMMFSVKNPFLKQDTIFFVNTGWFQISSKLYFFVLVGKAKPFPNVHM